MSVSARIDFLSVIVCVTASHALINPGRKKANSPQLFDREDGGRVAARGRDGPSAAKDDTHRVQRLPAR